MEKQRILSVENLKVVLNDKKILDNVSFSIKAGEVLAIIGPNGAGKSILLKTTLGLIKPTAGKIEWMKDVNIGYLPQRFHVDYYLPMTIKEFLKLKPRPAYSLTQVLEMVNMKESWLNKNLAHLSSGELQKVLLAWAVLDKPHILLFDEPTENVDIVNQESIYKLLHELQKKLNIALIIISHDLHIVYRYANYVLCLNKDMLCFGEPEILNAETLSKLYDDQAFFHHHHYETKS